MGSLADHLSNEKNQQQLVIWLGEEMKPYPVWFWFFNFYAKDPFEQTRTIGIWLWLEFFLRSLGLTDATRAQAAMTQDFLDARTKYFVTSQPHLIFGPASAKQSKVSGIWRWNWWSRFTIFAVNDQLVTTSRTQTGRVFLSDFVSRRTRRSEELKCRRGSWKNKKRKERRAFFRLDDLVIGFLRLGNIRED